MAQPLPRFELLGKPEQRNVFYSSVFVQYCQDAITDAAHDGPRADGDAGLVLAGDRNQFTSWRRRMHLGTDTVDLRASVPFIISRVSVIKSDYNSGANYIEAYHRTSIEQNGYCGGAWL